MAPSSMLLLIVAATGLQFVFAQQLSDSLHFIDFSAFAGLSKTCIQALNKTVQCSSYLDQAAQNVVETGNLLAEDVLTELCVDSCRSSLTSLKSTAETACTADGDVMVNRDIAYPDQYCDTDIAQWRNDTANDNSTGAYDCEDCMLGVMKLQLEAPIAYNRYLEDSFTSATSSCSATGYAYATPGQYALNSTATTATGMAAGTATAPTSTSTCVGDSVTVKAGDSCGSIAAAHSVSTYGLIALNNLDIYCNDITTRDTLCLPEKCLTYMLGYGDSCNDLAAAYNVSTMELTSWNSNLERCINMNRWVNWSICVGVPGGKTTAQPTAPTTAAIPSNAAPKSNRQCGLWHNITSGDNCAHVDEECTKLQLGVSYCVQPVGDIAAYPGYTAAAPSTSFTRPATSSSRARAALPTTTATSTLNEPLVTSTNGAGTSDTEKKHFQRAHCDLDDCLSHVLGYVLRGSPDAYAARGDQILHQMAQGSGRRWVLVYR
ncbi:hypothetical protein QBC33DRAFT_591737 [Phialemonium atrogriseum]|uniref:LysM domain-containing protein n=1 Tax=Phialemonium atrogriseum TaxID=1093897 RepID=A0AAJ0FKU6_9PEZI|nr:uncharacterized protein QBC33DRAFT_591737 [Phialemonium atrogriseum]KAK1771447.1 hypothetical protein QBC33DRAFT_591737 [Phialemonium atrogriseum]